MAASRPQYLIFYRQLEVTRSILNGKIIDDVKHYAKQLGVIDLPS